MNTQVFRYPGRVCNSPGSPRVPASPKLEKKSMIFCGKRKMGTRFVVRSSEEKYLGPKQSSTNSHNDRKIDGVQLLLPLITALYTFLMHFKGNFMKKYFVKLISLPFSSFPCERILISPGMTIMT